MSNQLDSKAIKETYYAHFYNMYKSQVCPECVCEVSAQKPHRSFIISIWKLLFWVEAETRCFRVSLNANELLLPAPFSRIELCLYSSYLKYTAKKHLLGFDYHVYLAEIMLFKPY